MNTTYIDEANKHLQALSDRHSMLEIQLKEAYEKLEEKDVEAKQIIEDMNRRYRENAKELMEKIERTEKRCDQLELELERREIEISAYEQQSQLMDEIIKYKPLMAKLTINLEQTEQYSHLNHNKQKPVTNTQLNKSQTNANQTMTLVERAALSLPIYDVRENKK